MSRRNFWKDVIFNPISGNTMNAIKVVLLFVILFFSAIFTVRAFAGTEQLLASASRKVSTVTADIEKTNYRGVYVFAKVTAVPTVETLTFTIQGKDYDGTYYTILASTASAATGTVTLKVYPGLTAAANAVACDALPDIWRVSVTHSAGSAFTYSIVANTIP